MEPEPYHGLTVAEARARLAALTAQWTRDEQARERRRIKRELAEDEGEPFTEEEDT